MALCLTFSVLFLSIVVDPIDVFAGTHAFGGGALSRSVVLATDRDTGTTNIHLTGTESSLNPSQTFNVNLQGTTYHSTPSGDYVTYQIAFVMRQRFNLGIGYAPSHDWAMLLNLVDPVWSSSTSALSNWNCDITDCSYSAIIGGHEYELGSTCDNVAFMVNSGSYFDYVDFCARFNATITLPYTADTYTFTMSLTYSNVSFVVTDYGLHSSSDDVVGAINNGTDSQNQGNQIAQEGNNIAQDTANTTHSIFDKISDFFAGFFDGIINALKSVFVPEDGYFQDFFQRLNDFFSEKLGALYTPIELFIRLLQAIQNASSGNAGIPFPGIEWDGTYIIEPQTVNLQSIADNFVGLQDKIYFVTDVIMVGAVIWLLQSKLREVLKG